MSILLPNVKSRCETDRFGPFVLQTGVDATVIEALYLRVTDAHTRFNGSPLAQVANQLEKEVVVSSIFGTNSIEGGTLTELETQQVLDMEPARIADIEQRRAVNLKAAYQLSTTVAANPDWELDLAYIRKIHAAITNDLPDKHNRPGLLRDNPKNRITYVGDAVHGGRYKPPQYGADVKTLLSGLLDWHRQLRAEGVPALIRAPLIHYYYEQIHPFWDGNGRVGRVLEATLLQQAGFRYAPFAQAGYYFDHIDEYFSMFNHCRKAATSKNIQRNQTPNTEFIVFFLEGMLSSLNKLHDRVNRMISILLFETHLKRQLDEKAINARQYTIVAQILTFGDGLLLSEMRTQPWYQSLYVRLTDKTRMRDLKRLRENELIWQDDDNRLWPGFLAPEQ